MRWKPAPLNRDWHPWFAWYPVRLGSTTVWLETIERKRAVDYLGHWDLFMNGFLYREKQNG